MSSSPTTTCRELGKAKLSLWIAYLVVTTSLLADYYSNTPTSTIVPLFVTNALYCTALTAWLISGYYVSTASRENQRTPLRKSKLVWAVLLWLAVPAYFVGAIGFTLMLEGIRDGERLEQRP